MMSKMRGERVGIAVAELETPGSGWYSGNWIRAVWIELEPANTILQRATAFRSKSFDWSPFDDENPHPYRNSINY